MPVCQTADGTVEFPIAGAVTSFGTVIVLLAVLAVSGVVYWVRR